MQYSEQQNNPDFIPTPPPQSVSTDTFNPYGMQSQNPKVVELKLNNDDVIAEFEKFLRGVEWDNEKNCWVQLRKPLMNNKGIGVCLTAVYPYSSKIITLGKTTQDEAKIRGKMAEEALAGVLFERYDEFDLDVSFYHMIVNTAGDLIYHSLTRAINGAENRAISEHSQTIEHVRDAQQKQGILSSLNPFRRNQ